MYVKVHKTEIKHTRLSVSIALYNQCLYKENSGEEFFDGHFILCRGIGAPHKSLCES